MNKLTEHIAALASATEELETASAKVMEANNLLLATLESTTPEEREAHRAEVFGIVRRLDAVINTIMQG